MFEDWMNENTHLFFSKDRTDDLREVWNELIALDVPTPQIKRTFDIITRCMREQW